MSEIEKLQEENIQLKNRIKDLTVSEERYKDFIKMYESMISRLKEENETLIRKNKQMEKEINYKKDMSNYDKFMISFKQTS